MLNKLFPIDGSWLSILLVLALLILPVLSFDDARWVEGTQQLLVSSLAAGFMGTVLARSRWSRYTAVPTGLLIGALVVYLGIGQILPSWGEAVRNTWAWLNWLPEWFRIGDKAGYNPLLTMVNDSLLRNSIVAGRVWAWINTVYTGGTSSDNLIFLLILGELVWAISFNTTWMLHRSHSVVNAIIPVGATLAVNTFLSNRGMGYVIAYLVVALLVLMRANYARLQRLWQSRDIDYSPELGFDLTVFTASVSGVLVVSALLLPSLRTNPIASTYWIYVSRPWGEVESTITRLFSGLNNPNPDLGTGSKGSLVLGGSFERSENSPIFMYVTTDETILKPSEARAFGEEEELGPPNHYWRGETWDYYTGRRWDHSERLSADRTPQQEITEDEIPGAIYLRQTVEIVAPRADILFAANSPKWVDQPYRILQLGQYDYSALYLKRMPLVSARYTVTSTVPRVGQDDLRQASTAYPQWIRQKYLQLPSTAAMDRVRALAREITKDAPTAYDKAVVIESYLRALPYDPNIKLPPGDFDAVEWFLFTQKGYCDYFGTVMAVMLRTLGIPARLATGYFAGDYDYTHGYYVVSERHSHAWPEVYFPPYGWIEFEPTPGRPSIVRPPGSLFTLAALPNYTPPDLPEETTGGSGWFNILISINLSFLLPYLTTLVALGILVAGIWPIYESRLSHAVFVRVLYGRMLRYAAWAGIGKLPAQTPNEFAAHLSTRLAGVSPLRWPIRRVRASEGVTLANESDPQAGVVTVTATYVEATYSGHQATLEMRQRMRAGWQASKGYLWPLILRRAVRMIGTLFTRRR